MTRPDRSIEGKGGDMSVILSRMEKHIIILLIRLMDIRQIMV